MRVKSPFGAIFICYLYPLPFFKRKNLSVCTDALCWSSHAPSKSKPAPWLSSPALSFMGAALWQISCAP